MALVPGIPSILDDDEGNIERIQLAPTPVPPAMPRMRDLGDAAAMRQQLFDNMLEAARNFTPVSNPRHTLALTDPEYAGPEIYSIAEQKKALLENRTLSRKLRGIWRLTDNETGKELARRKATIANVPWFSNRGTFIHNGTEYTMASQMRLRSGVFTRIKDNGEIESHVNVLPGKGYSHRVYLDPESGIFRLQLGNARIPLLPVLKAVGVGDKQLREAWGNDLFAANMQKADPRAIDKVYDKLVRRGDPHADQESKRTAVAEALAAMELDPEVTGRTLGRPHRNLTPEAMLDVSRKVLAVNRGEEPPDDRDNLAFQTFVGPEDMLAERLSMAKGVVRKLLFKAAATGKLDHIPAGALTKAINAGIMSSGLGSPLEEINPGDILEQLYRVTRLGEGGISGVDAIPAEARSVLPSQFGFIDPIRSPESEKVGVDLRLIGTARKGSDGRLYVPLVDARTGRTVYKTPQDVADIPLGFPGKNRGEPMAAAIVGKDVKMVPREQIRFFVPSMENAFSPSSNLVPLKSQINPQRVNMGGRMMAQAIGTDDPEAAFVQAGMPGKPDRSYDEEYAKYMGALRSPGRGRVIAVGKDKIRLRTADGVEKDLDLYHNFPFNRKSYFSQTPTVTPGDFVEEGDLLARSNYTDDKGVTSFGKNARTAYFAYDGHNYEDAIVISESFAKRMTANNMYQHSHEWESRAKRGKNAFISVFPAKYPKEQLANFDDNGVIKPGTEVHEGDPLVLSVVEREHTKGDAARGHRGRGSMFSDATVTWDHQSPGIVTDVAVTDKGATVVVGSRAPMVVGDKLAGRFGDKGVLSKIVPDDKMPAGPDGTPYEVLLNPLGVISRGNPAQVVEAALGKIASKTGKPYKITDFEDIDDLVEFARAELKKHNLSDLDDVTDPETGRKIPKILAGNRYFLRLHHSSEGKLQGRGLGGYTTEGAPAKGGKRGSARIGIMELNALRSHGATAFSHDAASVRGQADPDYWAMFLSGHKPPTPKVPFVYEKFVNQLKASGINVVRDGPRTHIMAMTDKDIDFLAESRELQNAETVDWKQGLTPRKGGLFDETLTGGHGGNRWAKITLSEPLPNPVMEEPIRRLLNLTEKQLEDVIAGKGELNGKTGPQAVAGALDRIDLSKEIARARAEIASGKRTARDAAVRRLGYLRSAERLGVHPRDWMLTKVPVLPPAFRPVSTMGPKKLPLVADPNFLYKELFDANRNLAAMRERVDDVGDERLAAYRALQGVVGLGDPIHPKNQERQVKGILRGVFGSSPKRGVVQRRLLGSTVDFVGRSVITPDPDLDMDSVGLPEEAAWEVYRPFIVRSLVRRGLPRLQAARAARERTPDARKALLDEMASRPVVINRAPTLHRYGMMAAWPRLVKGNTLRTNPTIIGGFGGDYDGDTMSYHVPVSDDAAREAVEKMMPSRNLFSVARFGVQYKPSQEYLGGLYEASARIDKQNKPRVFATTADALRAYRQGELGVDRQVVILEDRGKRT